MKKFLGFLIIILMVGAIAWAGATWFIAQKTEEQVKAFIEQNNQASAVAQYELIEYQSQSFTRARAVTKVTTGVPAIDNVFSDVNLVTEIKHGPIIFEGGSLKPAVSLWKTQLDLESLPPESQTIITRLFGEQQPFSGETLIGFDKNAEFSFYVSPFSDETDTGSFGIEGIKIEGKQSLDKSTGPAKITTGEIYLKSPSSETEIPSVTADINVKGFIGSQMLGNIELLADGVRILPQGEDEPIRLDLKASSHSNQNNNEVDGDVKVLVNNIQEPSKKLSNIQLDMHYEGLSAAGLVEFSRLESELNNLQSQLTWSMDATQSPEGQEKMMMLIDKMQSTTQEMIQTLFDQVLLKGKSQFKQLLQLNGQGTQSTLDMDFVYVGTDEPVNVDQLMLGDISSVLKSLAGTMDVHIHKNLLDEQLSMLMGMAVAQGVITDSEEKFSFQSSLTDGQITLNGETMPFDAFLNQFMGAPNVESESVELQLPEDLEARIQEEGLTPEIMQELEESDDVDPALLEQLKELQKMMEAVESGNIPTE